VKAALAPVAAGLLAAALALPAPAPDAAPSLVDVTEKTGLS
jgi:hypothetical protein